MLGLWRPDEAADYGHHRSLMLCSKYAVSDGSAALGFVRIKGGACSCCSRCACLAVSETMQLMADEGRLLLVYQLVSSSSSPGSQLVREPI